MSLTFTKLFSSITESTIWCEPANTRLVWITMLAMADRKGRIHASIPGLANRARVPLEDTEKALQTFLSPDRYSRTEDFEGRRIEAIHGGWRLLNYAKYREIRDADERREYQRNWDREHRSNPTQSDKSDQTRPGTTKAEAEAEARESRGRSRGSRLTVSELPADWRAFCRHHRADLDPDKSFAAFRDYWIAKPGKDGTKSDWFATWRNWVRREHPGTYSERKKVAL